MLTFSTPNSQEGSPEVSQQYLRGVVESLAFERVWNTTANEKAKQYVLDEFKAIFGKAEVVGEFGNVCAGADPAKARILIGAHFDSVPGSPAADDNASAVAVMLAAARILYEQGRDDISFVAFNCEEFGISGSQEIAALLPADHKLEAVHVLEMVGFCSHEPNSQENPLPQLIQAPTVGDFVGLVSNNAGILEQVMKKAGRISAPVVGLTIPDNIPLSMIRKMSPHLLRSDHIGFWNRQIPAIMWTDTAEFRNKNYHQSTDTPETLDYEFMTQVTKLLVTACE